MRREGAGVEDPKAPFRLAHEGTLNDGCFDNWFFYEAFGIFDNQSIEKSLASENSLVRSPAPQTGDTLDCALIWN